MSEATERPIVGANGVMLVEPSDERAMELAANAGLRTEWAGAATCVWSDETNCVTLRDLKRLIALASSTAGSPQTLSREEILSLALQHGWTDAPTVRLAYQGFRLQDFAHAIVNAARSQQHQQAGEWISVEDRLPTEAGTYAVWLADPSDLGWATDRPWTAWFEDGVFGGDCPPLEDGLPITHWMRLQPPRSLSGQDGGSGGGGNG